MSSTDIRGIESPLFVQNANDLANSFLAARPEISRDDEVLLSAVSEESAKVNSTTIERMAQNLAKVPNEGLISSTDDHSLVENETKENYLKKLEQFAQELLNSNLVKGDFDQMIDDIKRNLKAHGTNFKNFAENVLRLVRRTRELSQA